MGDTILDTAATLTATVLNLDLAEEPHTLRLLRDGESIDTYQVLPPGDVHAFRAETPGLHRIQLERSDGVIVALTSAIRVPEPDASLVAALAALAALRLRRQRPHVHHAE